MDKFTRIMISDYESKLRKMGRKNTKLKKELEVCKYQQAQMCKTTLKVFEALGIKGKEVIELYEYYR